MKGMKKGYMIQLFFFLYFIDVSFSTDKFTPPCNVCLKKFFGNFEPSDLDFINDPINLLPDGTKHPWCKKCALLGPPDFLSGQGLTSPEGIWTVKTGKWFSFPWKDAKEVYFQQLSEGETKTIAVKPSDRAMGLNADKTMFQSCLTTPGSIFMRAFGDQGINGSKEASLKVVKGESASCSDTPEKTGNEYKETILPNGLSENSNLETQCSTTRGFIKDGKCYCANDYAGPPTCDGSPVWKWVITFCGGIAAVISIAVSIHAYMQRRKAGSRLSTDSPMKVGEDIEVLRATPDYRGVGEYTGKSVPIATVERTTKGSPRECTL